MLRLRQQIVLARDRWIDDVSAAVAVAEGNECRGHVIAEQRYVRRVRTVRDTERATGGVARKRRLLEGGEVDIRQIQLVLSAHAGNRSGKA